MAALERLVDSLLFGAQVADPGTLSIVVVIRFATALLACTIPAGRAARIALVDVPKRA